jgi:hypothetical protein
MHALFCRASATIEFNRQRRILGGADAQALARIHAFFDYQHQELIQGTNLRLTQLQGKSNARPLDLSIKTKKQPRKQARPMPRPPSKNEGKPVDWNPPSQPIVIKEDDVVDQSVPLVPLTSGSSAECDEAEDAKMQSHASRILNNWYRKHHSHPYPSNEVNSRLAKMANLSAGQVRKWFANRRRRDGNIKPRPVACQMRRGNFDEVSVVSLEDENE